MISKGKGKRVGERGGEEREGERKSSREGEGRGGGGGEESRAVGRVKNSVRPGGGATTPIVPGRVREGAPFPTSQGVWGSTASSPTGVWGPAPEANAFFRKSSRKICTNYVKPFEM